MRGTLLFHGRGKSQVATIQPAPIKFFWQFCRSAYFGAGLWWLDQWLCPGAQLPGLEEFCRHSEETWCYRRTLAFQANQSFCESKNRKTRFKAARHQMSKLDAQDLVQLVSLAFAEKSAEEKLWPFSGQLLRTRFRQVLSAIGLPTNSKTNGGTERGLDLGSLRAGGATYLLMLTEDSELVRRRGRWIAPRTMEVYLQEIASTVYFPQLPSALEARVLQLASACPGLLVRLERFVLTKVPPQFWHDFFCRMDTDGNTGRTWRK